MTEKKEEKTANKKKVQLQKQIFSDTQTEPK